VVKIANKVTSTLGTLHYIMLPLRIYFISIKTTGIKFGREPYFVKNIVG